MADALDAHHLGYVTAHSPGLATPKDSGAPIILRAETGTIAVDVPGDSAAQQVTDGTVVYGESAEEASVAVQPVADGFRALITIPDASQPQSYDFEVGGDVAEIVHDGDGGLTLLGSKGQHVGQVGAPWAVDAAGDVVPTRFEVDGRTITQVVRHDRAGAAYPVIADPWIAAAALAAAAWCARGALLSVPSSALSDMIDGEDSSWRSYATNAVVGCLVGEVGSWVWRWLPGRAKTWAVNQVFRIALRWRS